MSKCGCESIRHRGRRQNITVNMTKFIDMSILTVEFILNVLACESTSNICNVNAIYFVLIKNLQNCLAHSSSMHIYQLT